MDLRFKIQYVCGEYAVYTERERERKRRSERARERARERERGREKVSVHSRQK